MGDFGRWLDTARVSSGEAAEFAVGIGEFDGGSGEEVRASMGSLCSR